MKVSDIKPGGKLFQLFIGAPGSGKTVAAASYPPPIYFFDLDKRIDSLATMFPGRTDIEYDPYGPEEFEKFWNKIQQIRAGNSPFKTYVLDSLTSLARMAIGYSVSLRGGGGLKKGVIAMTQVDDFNGESRVLSVVMDAFRGANFKSNFILTAHLVETSTKKLNEDDVIQQRVLTGGKTIAAEIPGYFNEIYYFTKTMGFSNDAEYKMHTMIKKAGIDTKTALPLPAEIVCTMKPGEAGLYQKIQSVCKTKGIDIG